MASATLAGSPSSAARPGTAPTGDTLSLLEEAGFDRRAYFQLLRSRKNLSVYARQAAEAVVTTRRCFLHDGPVFVFGDSTAREVALRLAVLRNSSMTHSMGQACTTGDVYFGRGPNLMPSRHEQLPQMPCRPSWLVWSIGMHHLYNDGRAVGEHGCDDRRTYAERLAVRPHLSDRLRAKMLYAAFPRCWSELAYRVLESEPRSKVIFASLLPPDEPILLSRAPKDDWAAFLPLGVAQVWLAAQRNISRSLAAVWPKRFGFADLGQAAADNPGVRCDGMHFGAKYPACAHSAAAMDAPLVSAIHQACRAKQR